MGWTGRAPDPQRLLECAGLFRRRETAMPRTTRFHPVTTTIGIDMGKNTLHMIGLDANGAIVLREKVSRGRIGSRLANLPPCLIGVEAGMATHYVARELAALGHDVKQVPPAYAKPFRQGHKNDFRDAHAVAEAVQRPTTRFVPAKTDEQLDLQALHRVRSRLVSERTAVINQIRGFLLERGIIVRQGLRFLRQLLPDILAKRADVLSPRMVRIVAELAGDWRRLDERIETVTDEIEPLAKSDDSCRRVMTVPGLGPLISSAMVAAIGNGPAFAKGRDYSAWLGLVSELSDTAAFETALTDLFLGPDEGLGSVVVCFDVGIDVILQLLEACEGGAAEPLPLQDRKPHLDLIEPGRTCRREMKLQVGVGLEPMLVLLVGVEVVEDDVKLPVRKSRGDAVHEIEKLDAATAF